MTITRTLLWSNASTSNTTNYNSSSASPAANALLLAYVIPSDTGSSDPTTAGHRPLVTNSPWGLTWTEQTAARISRDFGSGNITAMFLYTATTGGSAPGADTFDTQEDGANDAYTGMILLGVQYTDSSGSVPTLEQVVNDVETGSANPLLNTLGTLGSSSWVEACFVLDRNPPAGTVDTGWTESYDNGHNSPARGAWLIHSNGITTDNTPSGTWTNSDYIAVGVEIAEPAGATPLTVQEATHAHTADNLALTQHNILAIQEALHAHAGDNVALTQHHLLTIAGALHAHSADNLTLSTGAVALVIQDSSHAQAADNLGLTQHHVLAIAEAAHAHVADNLGLTQHNVLAVQDSTHAHTADNLVLVQHHVLVIQESSHGLASDEPTFTQHHLLVIQDATSGQVAEVVDLSDGGSGEGQDYADGFVFFFGPRLP